MANHPNLSHLKVYTVFMCHPVCGSVGEFSQPLKKNFVLHTECNIPIIVQRYWISCWNFITPLLLLVVAIFSWANKKPDELLGYTFPRSAQWLGWFIEFSPLLLILIASITGVVQKYLKGEDIIDQEVSIIPTLTELMGSNPKQIKIYNDEGDPMKSWWKLESWRGDTTYEYVL